MNKPSHRNLIIALGILVVAVIILTSIYFKGAGMETKSVNVSPEKKVKPAVILKTVVKKFSSHISF